MMQPRISCFKIIFLSFLSLLFAASVSAADHPIYNPIAGYSVATDQKGPGRHTFARSSGNDMDVQGDKTTIRYELNSGQAEPEAPEIIKRYAEIARSRNGWVYRYTDRTLYMGFAEQSGREYFAEVYIGDEYYELTVVERNVATAAAGGVAAPPTSKAPQIEGPSKPSTQTEAIAQAPKTLEAAGSSSKTPEGLKQARPEGLEGADGQSSGGSGGSASGIQIISPASGTYLFAGEPIDVRWTTTGAVGSSVEIGYSVTVAPPAKRFQSLAKNVAAASGVHRVTLPPSLNSRGAAYSLIVRSDRPPYRAAGELPVGIYPRVDLKLFAGMTFDQRDFRDYSEPMHNHRYCNVARFTFKFQNIGIEDVNEIGMQVELKDPDTNATRIQGAFSVTGAFLNGQEYTLEPLLCLCQTNIRIMREHEDNGTNCMCQESSPFSVPGSYLMNVKMSHPREPAALQDENNEKFLIIGWEYIGWH